MFFTLHHCIRLHELRTNQLLYNQSRIRLSDQRCYFGRVCSRCNRGVTLSRVKESVMSCSCFSFSVHDLIWSCCFENKWLTISLVNVDELSLWTGDEAAMREITLEVFKIGFSGLQLHLDATEKLRSVESRNSSCLCFSLSVHDLSPNDDDSLNDDWLVWTTGQKNNEFFRTTLATAPKA